MELAADKERMADCLDDFNQMVVGRYAAGKQTPRFVLVAVVVASVAPFATRELSYPRHTAPEPMAPTSVHAAIAVHTDP